MNREFTVLTFSLSATERVATLSGSMLDSVQTFDKGAEMLLSSADFISLGDNLLSDRIRRFAQRSGNSCSRNCGETTNV